MKINGDRNYEVKGKGSPSRTYSIALSGVPGFRTTPALAPRLFT